MRYASGELQALGIQQHALLFDSGGEKMERPVRLFFNRDGSKLNPRGQACRVGAGRRLGQRKRGNLTARYPLQEPIAGPSAPRQLPLILLGSITSSLPGFERGLQMSQHGEWIVTFSSLAGLTPPFHEPVEKTPQDGSRQDD